MENKDKIKLLLQIENGEEGIEKQINQSLNIYKKLDEVNH